MRASVEEISHMQLVHWKEREEPHALIGGQRLKKEPTAGGMALASTSDRAREILPITIWQLWRSLLTSELYVTEPSSDTSICSTTPASCRSYVEMIDDACLSTNIQS